MGSHFVGRARRFPFFFFLLGLLLAPNAQAQDLPPLPDPLTLELAQTDNTSGGAALDGFVTNDLLVNTAGRLLSFQMFLFLEEGSIYQDPFGTDLPPTKLAVEAVAPSLAYDTFLAVGSPYANGDYGISGPYGKAVDLPHPRDGAPGKPVIDEQEIDIAWGTTPGEEVTGVEDFLLSRLTLSDDARGHWSFVSSVATRQVYHATVGWDADGLPAGMGTIEDGLMDFSADINFLCRDCRPNRESNQQTPDPPRTPDPPQADPPRPEPPQPKLPQPEPPRPEPPRPNPTLPNPTLFDPLTDPVREIFLIDEISGSPFWNIDTILLVDPSSFVAYDGGIEDDGLRFLQDGSVAQLNSEVPEPTTCLLMLSSLGLLFLRRQQFFPSCPSCRCG